MQPQLKFQALAEKIYQASLERFRGRVPFDFPQAASTTFQKLSQFVLLRFQTVQTRLQFLRETFEFAL